MTTHPQSNLLEAIEGICDLRASHFSSSFCESYHDMETGNWYHHLMDLAPGCEWLCDELEYWLVCYGDVLFLQEGDEYPREVQQYYAAEFPLALEPWAEKWLRERGVEDIDDILMCKTKKISVTDAQALMRELVHVAEKTEACPFKPFVYKKQ